MQSGFQGERLKGMRPPHFDRFAEHNVAGADREVLQDKGADQVAQRVEGLVLSPEFEGLVDAAEDRLRPLLGGPRVRDSCLQIVEEDLDDWFAVADDVETVGAGLAPFLVSQRLQVRHASEAGFTSTKTSFWQSYRRQVTWLRSCPSALSSLSTSIAASVALVSLGHVVVKMISLSPALIASASCSP
ncbi:hypothetical protein [Bradyrhizobium mercantei]|uniref:hypothetical protein n=1 Tax=Bradyrhizobium mercantei TaxID=1904807 RepID=UPI0009789418|nr:hypothetical protein [Bradyrhizobium mercantei]